MKRKGHLFEEMLSDGSIREAIKNASRGKMGKPSIRRRIDNLDGTVLSIKNVLSESTFKPAVMQTMTINEYGKERLISKSPFFPDQIIHWLVIDDLRPLIQRGMDNGVCGSIPGRGTKEVKKLIKRWFLKDRRGTKWCLKIDIHHYYQSIDRSKLMSKIGKLIKDEKMIDLLKSIVGDPGIGIPIGTYWSQWFANLYLQDFDHFIHEKLGIHHSVRYVDDVVIFSSNRRKLVKAQKAMDIFLKDEGLEMKPNWAIFKTSDRDIDFVGCRFHPNGRISIRKRIWRVARRTILRIAHHGIGLQRARRLMSYNGWFQGTNNYIIKTKYLPKMDLLSAKSLIAQSAREKENNPKNKGGMQYAKS
jgi:hypothetical protein